MRADHLDAPRCNAATALATELGLPLATAGTPHVDLWLVLGDHGLELHESSTRPGRGLRVDWGGVPGAPRVVGSRRQPLARAVGLKGHRPTVLDATAGLGRDSLLLAALGCSVMAVERSPVLGAMLRDALRRAADEPHWGPIVRERLQLTIGDARALLANLSGAAAPDVVYVDPMYPPRRKSALPKKEMRVLRRLVGDDPDASDLLAAALRAARTRVVVKRPRHAPPLAGEPTLTVEGKMVRYDVYLSPKPA